MGTKSATTSPTDSKLVAFAAAQAADRKKSKTTVVLDVSKVTLMADYFIFAGGESKAQVKAIAEEVRMTLNKLGRADRVVEGLTEGRWVLLDYGDVIVHILQDKERDYYKLEQFWNHALVVDSKEWAEDDKLDLGIGKKRESKDPGGGTKRPTKKSSK